MDYLSNAKPLWVPLVATIIAAATVTLMGYPNAGYLVGMGGTVLSLFGCGFYVVAFDSKKRWPGLSWSQRLTKVMTFER